ncbi:MAG TPA: PIG-L family deacetylase, partial [Candidatus Saccharimonadales bacterium]|nr:PIG-L family deacetylase [Candidatus Saccharimonadales bacterium]
PSGTLLLETRAGTELHIILLTSGDSGLNPDKHDNLGVVRLREWYAAGKLMGAHGMHYLGYKDGQLNNHSMIEISERIQELMAPIITDAPADTKIEFMTNDLNGITGHIDHIVAARAACHVFYSMKRRDARFTRIRLCCVSDKDIPESNADWLYMEAGRQDNEIDEVIDARAVRDEVIAIIRTHHTQRSDGEHHIARRGEQIGLDNFIVKK